MPDDYFLSRTWLGIGLKTGGVAVFVGLENTEGIVFNLQNPSNQKHFSLTNARLGLGLGGGTGLIAMCVFNCPNIRQLHGKSNDDWGINISLGEKWDALVKTLKNYKFFLTIAKIGTRIRIHDPKDLENIRNCLHYIYNEYDTANARIKSNEPKVICFDTPVSAALELSITYSFGGKIEIY
jgi:hypothetical protein